MSLTKKYKNYYYQLLLIRRFEERAGQLYGMGQIAGFCHLYIGQEAVAVGFVGGANKGDKFITSYRDHGHILALGADPRSVMAELTGKATGCSKGKGGSMHMFAVDKHFYGGHGIVGAQISIGTGLAFADKYLETDNVTFAFMGDGAVHQGQFYESMNLAKLWNLPVVYVIENNKYAMGTSVERSTAQPDLYRRGEGFDVPGKKIKGYNVLEVEKEAAEAASYARKNGPIILEVETYRFRGHSMSDPAKYRSRDEVEEEKEVRDPVSVMRSFALENGVLETELQEIEDMVKNQVLEAVEFAKNSPEPDINELTKDVY